MVRFDYLVLSILVTMKIIVECDDLIGIRDNMHGE